MLDLFKPSEGPMKVRRQKKNIYVSVVLLKWTVFFRSGYNFNLKEGKEGEKCETGQIFGRILRTVSYNVKMCFASTLM